MQISWDFIDWSSVPKQSLQYFYGSFNSYATNYHGVIIYHPIQSNCIPSILAGSKSLRIQSYVKVWCVHKRNKRAGMDVHSSSIQQGLMMYSLGSDSSPNGAPKKIMFCVPKPIAHHLWDAHKWFRFESPQFVSHPKKMKTGDGSTKVSSKRFAQKCYKVVLLPVMSKF